MPEQMTQGDVILLNTARVKYLMKMRNSVANSIPFDPTVAVPELSERLRLSKEPEAGVFVVQFNQAMEPSALQAIRVAGAETLKYLPDNSYLVRLPAGEPAVEA